MRVVGGFTEHQFAEKRLPTLAEINAVAPDTPVFLLHLYDRALLNAAALRAVGYTKDTPSPPGGEIVRGPDGDPTGLLLAKPNAGILYATLAKGPKLPFEDQLNSTRHFMRELNRLGVTGVIDAGGGFQNYPDDYAVIEKLAADGQLTMRIAYNLFTQKPKRRARRLPALDRDRRSTGQGDDYFRHNGAGEMLVFSAADFEDFREPRPDMPPEMERELEAVVAHLAQKRWPFRLHATYDETISRALDVFERVNRDVPFDGLHWFFDHAETISPSSPSTASRRSAAASPSSTAWRTRANTSSSATVPSAAEATPPVARMLSKGVTVSAGTDATRVASYNPWVSLAWLVTGQHGRRACALPASATASIARPRCACGPRTSPGSRTRKARRVGSRSASLPILSCPIATISVRRGRDRGHHVADLTIVGGKIVYGAGDSRRSTRRRRRRPCPIGRRFAASVVTQAGQMPSGADKRAASRKLAMSCGCANACTVQGMITPLRGRANCRSATSNLSGVRSAAPVGPSDLEGGEQEEFGSGRVRHFELEPAEPMAVATIMPSFTDPLLS